MLCTFNRLQHSTNITFICTRKLKSDSLYCHICFIVVVWNLTSNTPQGLFSLTARNPKRIFALGQNTENRKSNQHLVCSEPLQTQRAPRAVRVTPPSSLPGNYTQHRDATALNSVCEHLCFILIYFVHLLVQCILRFFTLCHFSLWKVSQEHSTLLYSLVLFWYLNIQNMMLPGFWESFTLLLYLTCQRLR